MVAAVVMHQGDAPGHGHILALPPAQSRLHGTLLDVEAITVGQIGNDMPLEACLRHLIIGGKDEGLIHAVTPDRDLLLALYHYTHHLPAHDDIVGTEAHPEA